VKAAAVVLRDVTLREGLDTPGVAFDRRARSRIAAALHAAGVPEAEVVAPSRVEGDVALVRGLPKRAPRLSGLVYANGPRAVEQARACVGALDRVDLLMPLSPRRPPATPGAKRSRLVAVLGAVRGLPLEIGAGLPHAFSADSEDLIEIARAAVEAGSRRLTLYDTNGGAEPFAVHERVARVVAAVGAPVFFHGHDDLGLATANAWAAVRAGASGLDVTVNGLGDRAGNASLEQLAALLHLRGVPTGVRLSALRGLSRLVARLSGVAVTPLAPVVGAYVFAHRSPAHLKAPAEFEALDPALLGARRRLVAARAGSGR
jgi:homocitrate synthase NifV